MKTKWNQSQILTSPSEKYESINKSIKVHLCQTGSYFGHRETSTVREREREREREPKPNHVTCDGLEANYLIQPCNIR